MKELTDAIVARFTAAGLAATITGGIWLDKAGRRTDAPFDVLTVIPVSARDESYGGAGHATIHIQHAIFHTDRATSASAMADLLAAFDNVYLTMATKKTISMRRVTEPFQAQVPDGDPNFNIVSRDAWGSFVEYEYTVY